jgi:hypothetical protein
MTWADRTIMPKAETVRWDDDRLVSDDTKEELSPSGRYRLVMRYYDQGRGYWRYSRGTVYRVSDGSEIADVKRNYSTFRHSFVTKDGKEYLISGRSYMGQTIVNLETGVELNDKIWKAEKGYQGFEFCWAAHWLSPDGNTLVVNGCHWGGPYEFKFFDFSDPANGWPELESCPLHEGYRGRLDPEFHEDGTISIGVYARLFKPKGMYEHELERSNEDDELTNEEWDDDDLWEEIDCKRVVLRREGSQMVFVSE